MLPVQRFMTWYLFASLVIVGAYDVWSLLFGVSNSTVSYALYSLGKRFPTLYLLLGVLIGHIVFPLHIHEE